MINFYIRHVNLLPYICSTVEREGLTIMTTFPVMSAAETSLKISIY